ncbi:MAG: lysophospholipid acyltransferase family protein, partial [Caedimonadaceae bacterium]
LISSHSDGQYIANIVGHYGIQTIAGSSSKGGSQALRKILRVLKDGHAVGVTPDGPRGPRFEVSDGIIQMARLSGADIIPVTFAISRRRVLKTWDRLIFALPFSRGVLMYGKPIHLEFSDENEEEKVKSIKKTIKKSLVAVSNEADKMLSQQPIE